jgi:PAS domain S-box-containing protein
VATGYIEDFTLPIDRLMGIIYALVIIVAVLLTGLTLLFSRSLSRPLNELIKGLQAFNKDKKIFKMHARSVAEIEAVGHSIENLTKTLVTSEQEKKDLLDLLDSIINSMPSILTCVDINGKVIIWNDKATQYTGIPRDRALHQPLSDVLPEFIDILTNMRKSLKLQSYYSETCQIQKKNRPELHFAVTIYPLHSGLESAVIRIDDISEQVYLEKALRQSNKMESIGTLAGGVAHDFNNILSAIIGYTELSQMNITPENKISNYLDKILKAANRAKNLVKQILTFSRQTTLEFSPLSIKLIVKEALKLLKASLPSTIEIHDNIESDAIVMGDPTQIHQILMNLCTNAGHAMREQGGILTVSLINLLSDSDFILQYPELKRGPYMQLTVSDTGSGIPSDVLEHIFDPFFTTKNLGEGTGMGLSVVHGVVKSLKGVIDVKSVPGKGTSFNVFLPIIESGILDEKKEEKLISGGNEQILFIDDELSLVEIGKKQLETLGYKVVAKTNALEALEIFRTDSEKFDLVITDMTMPKITGDKLARELISIKKNICILLCTGFSSGMTKKKARKMGIKGFLLKPVSRFEMAQMVRKLLDEAKEHN